MTPFQSGDIVAENRRCMVCAGEVVPLDLPMRTRHECRACGLMYSRPPPTAVWYASGEHTKEKR